MRSRNLFLLISDRLFAAPVAGPDPECRVHLAHRFQRLPRRRQKSTHESTRRQRHILAALFLTVILLGGPRAEAGFSSAAPLPMPGALKVQSADFNGDAFADLAVLRSNSISILISDGVGGFASPVTTSLTTTPVDFAVGDFTGDGKLDVAIAYNTSNVDTFIGLGNGSFGAPVASAFTQSVSRMVAVKLNPDAYQDIVVAGPGGGGFALANNSGTGTFSISSPFSTSSTAVGFAVGDADGDNDDDVLGAFTGSTNFVTLFISNGAGNYSFSSRIAPTSTGIAVSDFNADGKRDFVVSFSDSAPVIYRAPTGSLVADTATLGAAGANLPTGSGILVLKTNADSVPDVAVFNAATSALSVYTSNGVGCYALANVAVAGTAVFAADPNFDTYTDIVAANPAASSIDFYRQTNAPPIVDLNGSNDSGVDFTAAFVGGAGAKSISDTDATIIDADSPTLASVKLIVSANPDLAAESLTVAGVAVPLNADASGTGTVGGTVFQVNYLAATRTLAVTKSSCSSGVADFQTMLRGISYNNSSGNPSTTARTVAVTANDGVADSSTATATITVSPQADVSISKTDGQTSVNAGANTTYTITASNAGPSDAPGTTVTDTFPAACTSVAWTCAGAGGGTCSAAGSGNISEAVNLPIGASVSFSASCAISTAATGTLSNTATVAPPVGFVDLTSGNNSATDTSAIIAQQSTTTTITSDLPDPSVVGQPYPVAVTVTAQSSSPIGTVNVSDGSASCSATLSPSTSPTSTASCTLSSSTAGAKTLTASYTAASTAYGNSSGTTGHQVNAAATTISVSGPLRSRINQPSAFSFALAVTAPGGGTPTGTVTLSSGAASCTATLPATSCNLTFTTLGSRTVTASYTGDGNYLAATSSGAGNMQTLVFALSNMAVSKQSAGTTFRPGELLVYTVQVRNLGPDAAQGIRVRDQIPTGLGNAAWSCDASGGVACQVTGGSGNLDSTSAAFPVGGVQTFTFYGTAQNVPQILNQALIELPADTTVEDPVPSDNNASDLDQNETIFRDGLEDPAVNTTSGAYRLPGLALRSVIDEVAAQVYRLDDVGGAALQIYARQFDGHMQYALALRGSDGYLSLGAWQTLNGEPLLQWTATAEPDGYRLQSATLR